MCLGNEEKEVQKAGGRRKEKRFGYSQNSLGAIDWHEQVGKMKKVFLT